jgi:hypothetical protein
MRRKVFILSEPCDMRKSFDGLYGLVREMNPLTGAIFLIKGSQTGKISALGW